MRQITLHAKPKYKIFLYYFSKKENIQLKIVWFQEYLFNTDNLYTIKEFKVTDSTNDHIIKFQVIIWYQVFQSNTNNF